MKLDSSPQLDFSDVLIRPKRTTLTSRSQVNISREFKFPHSSIELSVTPIIAANMDTTGTFEVHKVLSKYDLITCMNKFYTIEDYKDNFNCLANPNLFMISTGISDDNFVKMCEIVDFTRCNWICIDIANGYMQRLVDFCRKVREKYPNKIIVAGNVATREMVEELIINGKVDVVKVGIGPGSACLTRLKTGVGIPQLSAIIECADAAHGVGGCIIGDGGITCPGDMSKAFCGGADFVMMGGVFSGHDENPGEIKEENGIKYKMFYGMSSELAMKKHYGKMEKYRSSEGRELKVKYKGSLINTLLDYLGGVRSTCTYINARKIKYMPKCTTFLLVSKQLNTHLVK
jgi:GMP reductase